MEHRDLEANQVQILDALRSHGIEGRSILDIGCGRGHLHPHLVEAGAASVVGIELNPTYLEHARACTEAAGLDDRISYLEGDFAALADQVDPADVTILDKSVHCYLDPEGLVRAAAGHTLSLCVITFPGDHWWFRWLLRSAAFVVRCLPEGWRPSWRVRFSRPDLLRSWLRDEGFVEVSHQETPIFITEAFVRTNGSESGSA